MSDMEGGECIHWLHPSPILQTGGLAETYRKAENVQCVGTDDAMQGVVSQGHRIMAKVE